MNTDEKVCEILAESLGMPIQEVTLEKNIQQELGADSLDVVDIVMSLNEEFSIKLPVEKLDDVDTVAELSALVDRIINDKK